MVARSLSLRSAPGLGVLMAVSLLGVASAGHASDGERATMRVLFIGNSYTRFNDLPRMVQSMSRSAPRGPRLETRRETRGGYDLRNHWRHRRVRARIANGHFDAVVLQGHSLDPVRHPDQMADYARRFALHTGSVGSRLVLFQTWARHPRSRVYRRYDLGGPSAMHQQVETVYREVGRELDATVAPVGAAWQRAGRELPDVRLHRRDGTHPDVPGTYLSACVLYGTLTGLDPRALTWRPAPMPEREAARIRRVAAATLAERVARGMASP